MSAKDGKTELMPVVEDGQAAAELIPERVTEVHTGDSQELFVPRPNSPVPIDALGAGLAPGMVPAIPHPTDPFLNAAAVPDFQHWARKWIDAYAPVAEAAVTVPGSGSLIAKGRRYARAQDRTVGDTEALELGCWLTAAENLDQIEDAALACRPAEKYPCIQAVVYAIAAVYVREHGLPR